MSNPWEPPARPALIAKIKRLIEEEWYDTTDRAAHIADVFYKLLPPVKRYKHSFDDLDLLFLRQIWDEVIRSKKNDVHLSQLPPNYSARSRITQLRFHGLVAKVRTEKGTQNPGHWLITKKGGQFLRDKIAIEQVVETEQNRVVGHSGRMIKVSDFGTLKDFGPHFTFTIGDQNELIPLRLL